MMVELPMRTRVQTTLLRWIVPKSINLLVLTE